MGWCGEGIGRCFGCGEAGLYVGQCLKASPRKCFFSCGEMGHLSLQCRRGPMCFGCRELGHTAVSCPKLRHLNDYGPRGEGASWVRNYNRRKWYGGTSVSCQTNAFQEKMYTNLGNKWNSSQEKEGVRAANKPKGNVWALVQDHVRNDPEVLEVFLEGRENLVH